MNSANALFIASKTPTPVPGLQEVVKSAGKKGAKMSDQIKTKAKALMTPKGTVL